MNNLFDLTGRVALVTGGSKGVGLEMATALAEAGADVMLGARTTVEVEQAAAQLAAQTGRRVLGCTLDVTNVQSIKAMVTLAMAEFGRIDVLVNNAGITQPLKLLEIAAQNYDAVMDVNLRGTLYMSQAVIPHLRGQKSGSIVNMSSVSAQRGGGIFGGPHYSAAKAGILGLTKAMARELAPDNVRANAICPGFIDTDITAGKLTNDMRNSVLEGIPMGRAGTAQEVAGCCLFLASDLSAYVTGSEVDVNGGSLIH